MIYIMNDINYILMTVYFIINKNNTRHYKNKDIMSKKTSPAFSISAKFKQTTTTIVPGPNFYKTDINFIKKSQPNATIGKQKRLSNKVNNTPAPGQYNADIHQSNGVIFYKSERDKLRSQTKEIGPGVYNPEYQKVMRKTSMCKFGKDTRDSNMKQESKPTPLTYNPNDNVTHVNQPRATFGHAARQDMVGDKKNIPGPGQYMAESLQRYKSDSTFKFNKQQRSKSKVQMMPGPLNYTIQSQFDINIKANKGFKISLNNRNGSKDEKLPGPTAYHAQKSFKGIRAPAFSITKESRKSQLSNSKQTPSPNLYNTMNCLTQRASSALITSSKRDSQRKSGKESIPGPGYYSKAIQYKTVGTGIKFTIPKSKLQPKVSKLPGPWSYNPIQSIKQNLKKTVFGTSQRESYKNRPSSPGPGDYKINHEKTIGIVIGKEQRGRIRTEASPGPNAYKIQGTIGKLPYYEKCNKKQ